MPVVGEERMNCLKPRKGFALVRKCVFGSEHVSPVHARSLKNRVSFCESGNSSLWQGWRLLGVLRALRFVAVPSICAFFVALFGGRAFTQKGTMALVPRFLVSDDRSAD